MKNFWMNFVKISVKFWKNFVENTKDISDLSGLLKDFNWEYSKFLKNFLENSQNLRNILYIENDLFAL